MAGPRHRLARDERLPLGWLSDLFHVPGTVTDPTAGTVVVLEESGRRIGLVVGATYPAEMAAVRAVAGDLPLLVPGLTRRAGPHGSTRKAIRQKMRQRTQQSLAALLDGDKAEFEID